MCLFLWKDIDKNIDLRSPKVKLLMRSSDSITPQLNLAHPFILVCIQDKQNITNCNYPEPGCVGNFSLMTRNPLALAFESCISSWNLIAERDDLPQWQCLQFHHSLRAKVLSQIHSQTHHGPSIRGHLSSSFPVYCLKTGKWLTEQRQLPKAKQCATC